MIFCVSEGFSNVFFSEIYDKARVSYVYIPDAHQMVVKRVIKFFIWAEFWTLHTIDIYVPPSVEVASVQYLKTVFTRPH